MGRLALGPLNILVQRLCHSVYVPITIALIISYKSRFDEVNENVTKARNKFNEKQRVMMFGSSDIGTDVRITGSIMATERLVFAGHLDGDLDGATIHITAEGQVKGDVSAKDLVVDGRIEGKITAVKVRLTPSAVFRGEMVSRGITIDEGADIEATFSKSSDSLPLE
jgi:cytoskeletal protein CcmA (bactofilin family)